MKSDETKVWVSYQQPETFDKEGFEALDWVELPEFNVIIKSSGDECASKSESVKYKGVIK